MKEMLSFQDITWCWRLIRHRRGKYWALVLLSVWKGIAPALSPFITKMIIELHRGRVLVDTAARHGTIMYLTLPTKDEDD